MAFNGKNQSVPIKKTLTIPKNIDEAKAAVKEKVRVGEEREEKPPQEKEELTIDAQEDFSKEQVVNALEEIILGYKQSHRNMEIAVFKQDFELRAQRVHFFLHGELQQDIFEKCKPEINRLLKQKLKHPDVEATCEILEEENTGKNLYTSTDKLNFLLEKSPALKELQKRFGLETDF